MRQETTEKYFEDLNIILEAERAGVKVLSDVLPRLEDKEQKKLAEHFLHDEGMNCQILKTIIENSGFTASKNTGDFVQKIESLSTLDEKLDLLMKGQEWVAKQIRRSRSNILKLSEQMLLEAMKIQHEENVDALKNTIKTNL